MTEKTQAQVERDRVFNEKISELYESARLLIHTAPEYARMKKAVYDAFINEGFTEAQALELTKG